MRQFCLLTYPPRSKWASCEKMIFFSKIGIFWSPLSVAKTHWIVNWLQLFSLLYFCMASYQGIYAKLVLMMSLKCSIVENDGELMLMVLRTHFLPQQQYSPVHAMFLAFHVWVINEDASFFHFFHKITDIRSWRCFSSSKIHTQFSHTFSNITMIFKVMSQYLLALFKRIHNHIRSLKG